VQHCDAIKWDFENDCIRTIRGQSMLPDQKYLTALPASILTGMDNLIPLVNWVKAQNGLICHEDAGRPAKMLIVELFSALLWLEMGSFQDIDTNHDGVLTREEVKERASKVFGDDVAELVMESIMNVADLKSTGTISALDMMVIQFVATDMKNHVATDEECGVMKAVVADVMGNRPSKKEFKMFMRELRKILDCSGDGKITREEAIEAIGKVKQEGLLA
jgi:Ca2+-binding EF-hand superfamily protein